MTRRAKPKTRLRGSCVALWGVYGLAQIVPVAPWDVIVAEWKACGWPA